MHAIGSQASRDRPTDASILLILLYIISLLLWPLDIKLRFFEHLSKYQVAICKECRYAIWPNRVQGHLQKQHKIKQQEAKEVGESIYNWSTLAQYPGGLTVPSSIEHALQQLPPYDDGKLCQL